LGLRIIIIIIIIMIGEGVEIRELNNHAECCYY